MAIILLDDKFRDEVSMNGIQIRSERKWSRRFWEKKQLDDSYEKRETKKLKRVDEKDACNLQDSTDSLISALNAVDIENYPKVRKLLEIACHQLDLQKQNKQLQAVGNWKLLTEVLWRGKERET